MVLFLFCHDLLFIIYYLFFSFIRFDFPIDSIIHIAILRWYGKTIVLDCFFSPIFRLLSWTTEDAEHHPWVLTPFFPSLVPLPLILSFFSHLIFDLQFSSLPGLFFPRSDFRGRPPDSPGAPDQVLSYS